MGNPTKNHPDDADFGQRFKSFCSDREAVRFRLIRIGTRGRWYAFIHSRSWWWLAPVAVATFVALFFLRRFGDDLSTGAALGKAAIFAGVIAFCWGIGVWAASGKCSDPAAVNPESEPGEPSSIDALPLWVSRTVVIVMLLIALSATCWSQISGMVEGEVSLASGFGGVLLKTMAIVAVLLPSWLENRRR